MIERLFDQGYKDRPEPVISFTIEAWNVTAPSITARLSEPESAGLFATVQQQIAALQAENGRLRTALEGGKAIS